MVQFNEPDAREIAPQRQLQRKDGCPDISKVRELLFRFVHHFGIDPALSMEIIAFWLWVEANGDGDILRLAYSLDDSEILSIVSAGKTFIESLHGDPQDLEPKRNSTFRQAAMEGINYFLNEILRRACDDLKEKEEEKELEELYSKVEYLPTRKVLRDLLSQVPQTPEDQMVDRLLSGMQSLNLEGKGIDRPNELFLRDGRSQPSDSTYQFYAPHGKGTRRGKFSCESSVTNGAFQNSTEAVLDTEQVKSFLLLLNAKGISPSALYRAGILSPTINILRNVDTDVAADLLVRTLSQPRYEVPWDERTLFVTFSNGYPFTKDELVDFFVRNFGDVQFVTVEEPTESRRPPLYAHVTFYSVGMLLKVLNGKEKVKFVYQGKHLWARRYIPKGKNKVKS